MSYANVLDFWLPKTAFFGFN